MTTIQRGGMIIMSVVPALTKRAFVPLSFVARSAFVLFVAQSLAPGVATAQTAPGTIAEIRVHGNHTTPDADILALSGLAPGEEATEARLGDAERKLRDSERFAGVELRRRFRSIENPGEILVMIVVDEHPSVSEDDLTPGVMKKFTGAGMWVPILRHADGYGLTYGAQVSFPNAVGDHSRVSIPLTWGGERRAAVQIERSFDRQIPLLRGSLSLIRSVNPHFDVPDFRRQAGVEAEQSWFDWLRTDVGLRVAQVEFGDAYDATHTAAGVHAAIDTRLDPSFPRNAVHMRVGWEHVDFEGGTAGRWLADLRGYVGVGGDAVLALRGRLARSDAALPLAEQPLLGGSESLRGYRAGHRAGDSLAAVSAEVRVPLNSPLSVGRFGAKAFVDAGTTWAAGTRLTDQPFDRGIGGGVYFGAAALLADVDVAWPENGKPRVHFGLGVTF